jgi:hypothetical protein
LASVDSRVIVVPNARTAATIIKKERMVISRFGWLAKDTRRKVRGLQQAELKSEKMRSGFTGKE